MEIKRRVNIIEENGKKIRNKGNFLRSVCLSLSQWKRKKKTKETFNPKQQLIIELKLSISHLLNRLIFHIINCVFCLPK